MNAIPCCERTLAKIAVRSLYFEIKAYPKPGLVSFVDAGAHQDINGETFYRSLFALRHYFYQISKEGLIEHSFCRLKHKAIEAEQHMLRTTQGINTHRGAIFALGILCVSVMRLMQKNERFTPGDLHQQLLKDWPVHFAEHRGNPDSHGATVRREHQVVDARQMAMRGYDKVFDVLPAFMAVFVETQCLDSACLYAYSALLIGVDDTNILYKKGKSGLDYAQRSAGEILAISCLQARRQKALELHHLFSAQGISPGGVADLVGVLLFLGQLFCESLRCHY